MCHPGRVLSPARLRPWATVFILYMAELADLAAHTKLHCIRLQMITNCTFTVDQMMYAQLQPMWRTVQRATEHWMAANRLRLNRVNLEKTELMWIGAKQSLLKIAGGSPPQTVGKNHITTDVMEYWVSCSLQTCHWTNTLPHSAPSASSSCNNYTLSNIRLTPSLHWCMLLSPAASTSGLVYWLVHRRRQQTSCNVSSTQLHEFYIKVR